jgi:hypothetical protein
MPHLILSDHEQIQLAWEGRWEAGSRHDLTSSVMETIWDRLADHTHRVLSVAVRTYNRYQCHA